MTRRAHLPTTALGLALRDQRSGAAQVEVAAQIGIPPATLSRIERGTHKPSVETARALARWLGWTTDQVLDAAETPAGPKPSGGSE